MGTNTKIPAILVAGLIGLAVTTPARADDLGELKRHLEAGEKLWSDVKALEKDYDRLSSSVKAKLNAKKERLENAAKSFVLVADAVRKGRPLPIYLTKSGGTAVSCGDKVFIHNVAQDKVLTSTRGSENKALNYVRVNVAWKKKAGSPNMRIICRDKGDGKPLGYGDAFSLKLDPADKSLDDGKPFFHAGTKTGYDPVVRLDDMKEIEKWSAYWTFRGGKGSVGTGIPMEMVATNRKDDGNVGGFCGVGPAGVLPVVRFGMSNHCGHVELLAALAQESVATPPRWVTDLASEAKSLANELRREIENARGSGSSSGTTTTKTSAPKVPNLFD